MVKSVKEGLLSPPMAALFEAAKSAKKKALGDVFSSSEPVLGHVANDFSSSTGPQSVSSADFDSEETYQRYKEIRYSAMDLLARRDYSFFELLNNLNQRYGNVDDQSDDTNSQWVLKVVQTLADEGLQCDRRFVESFINSRINRNLGLRRIKQDLYPKQVDSHLVDDVLQALDVDWFAIADNAYQRKYGQTLINDIKEYNKRMRFMAYRGHNPCDISELLTDYKNF